MATGGEIDLFRVRYPKVREFVVQRGLNSLDGFAKFKPTCYDSANKGSYRRHYEEFHVSCSVEDTWKAYQEIHPRDAWSGRMVNFGLQYSGSARKVEYVNDEVEPMEVNHVLLLNLRLLFGLINIAVAHKVVDIDRASRTFKLCYMEGGASEGSQWISLHEAENGTTLVQHLTYYKSQSRFRDKVLYPGLHTKAISEFHRNVRRYAESTMEIN